MGRCGAGGGGVDRYGNATLPRRRSVHHRGRYGENADLVSPRTQSHTSRPIYGDSSSAQAFARMHRPRVSNSQSTIALKHSYLFLKLRAAVTF